VSSRAGVVVVEAGDGVAEVDGDALGRAGGAAVATRPSNGKLRPSTCAVTSSLRQ
jgi:hypothetical protein